MPKPKDGLTKWFKEEWVDIKTGKKCGRKKAKGSKRKYPKCVPKRVANRMTKAQKRSAVKRKRARKQGGGGKPTNVKTFVKKKK